MHGDDRSFEELCLSTKSKHQTQLAKASEKLRLSNCCTSLRTFRSYTIAWELTLVEERLWQSVIPEELVSHSPPLKCAPSVTESSQFFNYMTRMIEISILEMYTADARAVTILFWIKVAEALKMLNNYQTLKAVASALGTPPIIRLESTWHMVDRSALAALATLQQLVSQENNYNLYRNILSQATTSTPFIPYIGLFIHDLTYLKAVALKNNHNSHTDPQIVEMIARVNNYKQLPPYGSSQYNTLIQKRAHHTFTRKSLIRETVSPEVHHYFKDASDVEIGSFASHWFLSRTLVSEKEIDRLSLEREPKKKKGNDISSGIVESDSATSFTSYLENNGIFLPKITVDSPTHESSHSIDSASRSSEPKSRRISFSVMKLKHTSQDAKPSRRSTVHHD
jgi:RasGEF domain